MTTEELKKELDAFKAEYYRNNFSTTEDFPKYSRFTTRLRAPIVATLPSTCEQGELSVLSSNGKLYVCSTANTWTAQT